METVKSNYILLWLCLSLSLSCLFSFVFFFSWVKHTCICSRGPFLGESERFKSRESTLIMFMCIGCSIPISLPSWQILSSTVKALINDSLRESHYSISGHYRINALSHWAFLWLRNRLRFYYFMIFRFICFECGLVKWALVQIRMFQYFSMHVLLFCVFQWCIVFACVPHILPIKSDLPTNK